MEVVRFCFAIRQRIARCVQKTLYVDDQIDSLKW